MRPQAELWMPVDQVKQREQVDPDDVDEVPVEATDFDGRVIFGGETTLPRHKQEPGKKTEADNHMQRVQAGHNEVERKENLGMARVGVLVRMARNRYVIEAEGWPRNVVFFEFFFILDALDAQECEPEEHRDHEAADQQPATSRLRSPNRKNNRQTTADEDSGVCGAKRSIDRLAGGAEISEIPPAINQIGAEQTAEEHDFSAQENPHSETGGIALLLRIGEVMQQLRMMLLFVMQANQGTIGQWEPPLFEARLTRRSCRLPRLRWALLRS